MNRRDFLNLTTTITLAAPLGAGRLRAGTLDYRPGVVSQALLAGRTVLVDFHAGWCPTCLAQGRILDTLRAGNPGYDRQIDFIVADWDRHRDGAMTDALGVEKRGTLVALTKKGEVGRLIGATQTSQIKALLDRALSASV
ncbi:thioredoxin family protein [Acidimangrovimonas sediminis]|uniref:thioredoxin family protein n=1 Tax=Acidimangrovimonas sediminis TaxID=2056283 RepID=UPI001304829F|nr:thioredoxin family protein [Acidimangrovimonas sediminis]